MIDSHIHILPGIDDGAKNLEESLQMALKAYDSGIKKMIVTPHSFILKNIDFKSLQETFNQFKTALKIHDIPLEVYLGMEIYVDDDLIDLIHHHPMIGLNSSSYYLIEFDFYENPTYIESKILEMLEQHYIPVIAHPERYQCIQKEPWLIYRYLKWGCLSQINKDSVFGMFGYHAQVCAQKLLDYGLVSLIASDGHDAFYRNSDMTKIQNYLQDYYDLNYSYHLLYDHPQAIIEDKLIIFHDD